VSYIEVMSEGKFVQVTNLRKHPDYAIFYTTWTRLFIIGIIPTLLLIYFNYKVTMMNEIQEGSQIKLHEK
jgi:hypothetical protein